MRAFRILMLLGLFAPSLSAQSLRRPDGWKVRFDHPRATEADLGTFVAMPPGWHITTGPAGIFWDPRTVAAGKFRTEAEVFLFDPKGRTGGYGLFFGGSDLEGLAQTYTYFLLRDGGEFTIRLRRGDQTFTICPWTSSTAIRTWADHGNEAAVRNVLGVEAGEKTVRFSVNGEEVARVPRSRIATDGVIGLRIDQGLNLHVSRLEVSPGS